MYKIKRFTKYSENIRWYEDEDSTRLVTVEYSKKYNSDLMDISVNAYRDIIKKLIKGIKSGNFIYDDMEDEETHMLGEFNKKNKFIMYSKKIKYKGTDTFNRLNYAIYKPELIIDNNGNKYSLVKIVIQSVKGHGLLGRKGYSEMED